MLYLLTIIAVLGVLAVTTGVVWLVQPGRTLVDERLVRYGTRLASWRETAEAEAQQRVRRSPLTDALTRQVERVVANRTFAQQIALDLARADLKLTVSEYLVMTLVVALAGTALATLLSQSVVIGLLFGLASLLLPRGYVKSRERRRVAQFNAQLGDTIGIVSNSLRAGYSLLQAMELVSRESPPPMGEEFGRVVREVGLGLSPERALENLVRRIASDDLDLMVTAIKVQQEVGGNLAQILDTIGDTIRERVRIKGEIRVMTAQQSLGGYIISGLPILLGAGMLLLNPAYILKLFTPGWYIVLPICGGLGIILGFIAMRRIVAIEV
jgi:tight adherence protein B